MGHGATAVLRGKLGAGAEVKLSWTVSFGPGISGRDRRTTFSIAEACDRLYLTVRLNSISSCPIVSSIVCSSGCSSMVHSPDGRHLCASNVNIACLSAPEDLPICTVGVGSRMLDPEYFARAYQHA
jgi:hypothetical protein